MEYKTVKKKILKDESLVATKYTTRTSLKSKNATSTKQRWTPLNLEIIRPPSKPHEKNAPTNNKTYLSKNKNELLMHLAIFKPPSNSDLLVPTVHVVNVSTNLRSRT